MASRRHGAVGCLGDPRSVSSSGTFSVTFEVVFVKISRNLSQKGYFSPACCCQPGLLGNCSVSPSICGSQRTRVCQAGRACSITHMGVPQGPRTKLHQQGLQTTELESTLVVASRSLKSRCQRGSEPSKALGGSLPPSSSL